MCLHVLGVIVLCGKQGMRLSEGSTTVTISSWLKGKRMQRGAARKLLFQLEFICVTGLPASLFVHLAPENVYVVKSSRSCSVINGCMHAHLAYTARTCAAYRSPVPRWVLGDWHTEQLHASTYLGLPQALTVRGLKEEAWSFLSRPWVIWLWGNLHEGFAARGQSRFSITSPRHALNIWRALMWCPALPQMLLNLKEVS